MEDEQSFAVEFKPTFVLIGIDTHPSMFESDDGMPSPFRNCILAAYRLCDALLLKTDKRGYSPFAIILHDKEEKSNLVSFHDNMIETNKLLKEMTLLREDELKAKYMRDYDLELSSFFQSCKTKFKDVGTQFYKRILLFITNDPDPVKMDPNKRFTALNEGKNFVENDITFQLVVPNVDFNFSIFYSELFSLQPQKIVEIICEDEQGLYEKLCSSIWFKHSMRKMCFYPFADDFTKFISVYKKSYIKYCRLLNNDFIAEDGTKVRKTRLAGPERPEINLGWSLQDADNKKTFPNLNFDLEDKLECLKYEFPIGYTLLYVSDRLTQIGEVIAEPKIVEADAKEELPYFFDFWQHCVNHEKVLVCAKKMTSNDNPRAVEFIPKLIHNNKVFLVKQIPFGDEIHEPEKEDNSCEEPKTQKQIEMTDRLIDALSLDFSPSLLLDMQHVNKEWYLKSKLLDEPREERKPTEFLTPADVDKKIDGMVDEYLSSFPQEKGTKRKKK